MYLNPSNSRSKYYTDKPIAYLIFFYFTWNLDCYEALIAVFLGSYRHPMLFLNSKRRFAIPKRAATEPANSPEQDRAEDITHLTFLNESSSLHTLRQRFGGKLVHTFCGQQLVTINPRLVSELWENFFLKLSMVLALNEAIIFRKKLGLKPYGFRERPVFLTAAGRWANFTTSVTATDFYARNKQKKHVAMCGWRKIAKKKTISLWERRQIKRFGPSTLYCTKTD